METYTCSICKELKNEEVDPYAKWDGGGIICGDCDDREDCGCVSGPINEWWCLKCKQVVDNNMVTIQQTHDGCGGYCE